MILDAQSLELSSEDNERWRWLTWEILQEFSHVC